MPPPAKTARALEEMYVKGGFAVRPLVEAILHHPLLHEGPALVKPPMKRTAARLWVDDMAYAERRYLLRARGDVYGT